MRTRNIISWIILITVIVSGLLILTNLQSITDYWRLRNYDPPTRIEKLADETTMNDATRRVFYVNHPELNDKFQFNDNCRTTEESIILGCFINNNGIYLLDVSEPKLDGVIEVTAAHEVLHAQYERLSSSERENVDKMTSDFFKTIKDKRIKETVENYRKKDPSVVPNELHSILATEVQNLSPELEEYYSQYFENRKKIVDYSQGYEQAFVSLEDEADAIERQLESMRSEIEQNRSQIDALSGDLNQEKNSLDTLLAANQIEEYNQSVSGFNRRVETFNSLINKTRQIINQYNSLIEELQSLSLQQQELNQAIDSNILQPEL